MFRHRNYRKNYRGITLKEFAWIVSSIVFGITFLNYSIYGFFANCIFELPVRWDVKACWQEQADFAKNKATEAAMPFISFP